MIIGVTGTYASGKDTIAEILQEMNFFHVSFSDLIREELKKRRGKITRDNLIALGNELREKYGASILARMALRQVKDGENYVFTSIRNPFEAKRLMQREDFLLVKVIAPEKVRLQRLLERNQRNQKNREEDSKTLEEMREKERKENSADPKAQQLRKVAEMAKVTIANDGTLEQLKEKVERLVEDYLYQLQDSRPDWDHYFMSVAEQIKKRCNCMSAKKGSVIVKDKIILSTGYNGTPKKVTHCTEGGCRRCTLRHLGKVRSGDYSVPCLCAHSEENAIVQAAYNGTSTKGAIMYTTFTPCTACAKMIINAGITDVIAKVRYPDDVGTKLLKEAGVKLRVLK